MEETYRITLCTSDNDNFLFRINILEANDAKSISRNEKMKVKATRRNIVPKFCHYKLRERSVQLLLFIPSSRYTSYDLQRELKVT